jgi:hypothetical protein
MSCEPLESAWAKLDRAKAHIDQLRIEVLSPADNPYPYRVPVVCQYEADNDAIVCRIGTMSHWPLIVGDAIHSLRGALDHAWWQCATKHLTREPDESEAKHVQFPFRKPGKNWESSNYIHWVGPEIESIVQPYQPPKNRQWSDFHALGSIDRLSNIDKHRKPLLVAHNVDRAALNNVSPDEYVDCFPGPVSMEPDASGVIEGPMVEMTIAPGYWAPDEGDEVVRIPVVVPGPDPHIKFQPDFTGQITLEGGWDLIGSLDQMGATVAQILSEIEPCL